MEEAQSLLSMCFPALSPTQAQAGAHPNLATAPQPGSNPYNLAMNGYVPNATHTSPSYNANVSGTPHPTYNGPLVADGGISELGFLLSNGAAADTNSLGIPNLASYDCSLNARLLSTNANTVANRYSGRNEFFNGGANAFESLFPAVGDDVPGLSPRGDHLPNALASCMLDSSGNPLHPRVAGLNDSLNQESKNSVDHNKCSYNKSPSTTTATGNFLGVHSSGIPALTASTRAYHDVGASTYTDSNASDDRTTVNNANVGATIFSSSGGNTSSDCSNLSVFLPPSSLTNSTREENEIPDASAGTELASQLHGSAKKEVASPASSRDATSAKSAKRQYGVKRKEGEKKSAAAAAKNKARSKKVRQDRAQEQEQRRETPEVSPGSCLEALCTQSKFQYLPPSFSRLHNQSPSTSVPPGNHGLASIPSFKDGKNFGSTPHTTNTQRMASLNNPTGFGVALAHCVGGQDLFSSLHTTHHQRPPQALCAYGSQRVFPPPYNHDMLHRTDVPQLHPQSPPSAAPPVGNHPIGNGLSFTTLKPFLDNPPAGNHIDENGPSSVPPTAVIATSGNSPSTSDDLAPTKPRHRKQKRRRVSGTSSVCPSSTDTPPPRTSTPVLDPQDPGIPVASPVRYTDHLDPVLNESLLSRKFVKCCSCQDKSLSGYYGDTSNLSGCGNDLLNGRDKEVQGEAVDKSVAIASISNNNSSSSSSNSSPNTNSTRGGSSSDNLTPYVEAEVQVIDQGEGQRKEGSHNCLGCQKPVQDRYVLHVRDHGYWHADCLRCCTCRVNLSTHTSCYVRDERVFCRTDYNVDHFLSLPQTSLFGLACVKCSLHFKKDEDWMRVAGQHRYHIACFLCKICKRQLGSNERYHLVNGSDIYCTNHYRDLVNGDNADGSGPPKKAKRNRTSYTEAQIKYLQERFNIDSNPDGNELEKIASRIGLKKRVVQVWFQNNRARLKKTANNTKGGNQENKNPSTSNGVTGVSSLQDDIAFEWDHSMEQSMDGQNYPLPPSPPLHMLTGPSPAHFNPYGMTTSLGPGPIGAPTNGSSSTHPIIQGPPSASNGSASSNGCTPRHDQVSPHHPSDLPANGYPGTTPDYVMGNGSAPNGVHHQQHPAEASRDQQQQSSSCSSPLTDQHLGRRGEPLDRSEARGVIYPDQFYGEGSSGNTFNPHHPHHNGSGPHHFNAYAGHNGIHSNGDVYAPHGYMGQAAAALYSAYTNGSSGHAFAQFQQGAQDTARENLANGFSGGPESCQQHHPHQNDSSHHHVFNSSNNSNNNGNGNTESSSSGSSLGNLSMHAQAGSFERRVSPGLNHFPANHQQHFGQNLPQPYNFNPSRGYMQETDASP